MALPDQIPFRLNSYRLAGFSRALGIEFCDHEIRVAELERRGLLNRTRAASFKHLWSYTIRIEWESTEEEIAEKIKTLLEAEESVTCRSAISIRSTALRTVAAQIPENVSNVPEWIEDNSEKLLQLPIPLAELSYDYRFLPGGEREGSTIEIAFVRKKETDKCLAICRSASLEPVFLGRVPEVGESASHPDVDPEYVATYQLARSAFSPKERPCDFLPPLMRREEETSLYRRLTKRVGLAAGLMILALLFAEIIASAYVDSRERCVSESSNSTKAAVNAVAEIEKNVKALEARLAAVRFGRERTEIARSLHDVASVPPQGVRFRKLSLVERKPGDVGFTVKGEVASHEKLAQFLSLLDTASFCQNVTLSESGTGSGLPNGDRYPHPGLIPFALGGRIR